MFRDPVEGKRNMKQKPWYSQDPILWIVIVVVASLVYFWGIAHESIWFDEAYSAMMAGRSPGDLLGVMTFDNHPPLYYLLLSAFISVFGNSVWVLRLPSVIGAIGLVSLGAGPVRRILGNRTAFVYAGIVLFTPVVLIYAHEARMYALTTFCVTASVLYGFLAVKYNRGWDWVGFGLASLAAAYLHYYGLMAAFFMHLLILLWLLLRKREYLRSALITGGAVAVGYLPWLRFFFQQVSNVNKGFWISDVTWPGILNAMIQPFAYKDLYPLFVPLMAAVLIFSALLIIIGLVIAKGKAGNEWAFGLFTLAVLLCSFVTPILISLVSKPIFYERYVTVLDGLFLLLISLGIGLLPRKWLQVAAVGLFALANVSTMRNVYTQYFNLPMNQVAEYLKKQINPGDAIVTSELFSMGPAVYYLPEAGNFNTKSSTGDALEQQLKIPFSPFLHRDQEVDNLVSSQQSFWYVTCNNGVAKDIRMILHGGRGWEVSREPKTFSEPFSINSVTVTKYIYTGRIVEPTYGTLNLHITGLRPPGNLIINLKTDYSLNFSRSVSIPFKNTEMTYAVEMLYFGDYVIQVIHDENNNDTADLDSKTGLISEGFGMVNMDKLDLRDAAAVKAGSTYDNLKFNFDEEGKTVEIKMYYSPFPWQ
jgi:4-amino-4-deoxy-L-arabinose transferase-like glycosyltransferase